MFPHTRAAQVGTVLWLAGCLLALWRGGRSERLIAAALLADLAAVQLLPQLNFSGSVRWWTAGTDLAVLAGLALTSWRSPRTWLRAALGFQFLAVLTHVPKLLDPGVRAWGYMTVAIFCGYAVILALVVGALMRPQEPTHAR